MTWRRSYASGDPEDDASEAQDQPWRAAVPVGSMAERQRVILEAWDEELTEREMAGRPPIDWIERRDRRRARLKVIANLVLFSLAVVGAFAGLAVAWMHVLNDPFADARAYFDAASRLNEGKALYPTGIDPNGNRIYLYPPMLAVLLRPLALLPFQAFAMVWELAVVASFVVLLRYLGVHKQSTWLAVGLLGVPIGWALTIAQAHVPMTLLLALGQPWSIALAANLKITPVLIAVWWLGRRDWESFFAFLVWLVLFVAAQLVVEFNGTVTYFRQIGFEQVGAVRNISPYAQSEVLWIALVLVGALAALALARTRWGWPAAVTLATLSPPRLLVYMLTGLLAALREPHPAGDPEPDDPEDPALVFGRAAR